MIDRHALLSDLQTLLRSKDGKSGLEADLLERSESPDAPAEIGEYLRAEHKKARDADRTAQNYEDWRSDFITQVAAAWVLSCVFARFLEDNELVDPPKLSGPRQRLPRARDEHEVYFRSHPTETDREYVLSVFDQLAKLPGASDIFGDHNPIHELPNWLSGDAASELLRFFQKIDAETGALVHDFTDPEWNTRFLGDLYQDLSEAARKKYALLQTPDFVERFILDRTLDPALDEFALNAPPILNEDGDEIAPAGFRLIDPACGSGHFLLGAFKRILDQWHRQEPSANDRDLVQRTLDSVRGVDVNPFAISIARFRLLVESLRECGIWRLTDAPDFRFHLTAGDSLLHGVSGSQSVMSFDELAHHYAAENAEELHGILKHGTYHAVVANPPYITVKDRALNQAYRDRYATCHGKYALAVPFMERIFGLAVPGGFTGHITTNAFMKRQFGRHLIEQYLPQVELTHVIDTSGCYLPGHGTPTAILFGRSRAPSSNPVRVVMGVMGEPGTPDEPARGKVWTSITTLVDLPGSENTFVSVTDMPREKLARHPWTIGGGGASELKDLIDRAGEFPLSSVATSGIGAVTLEDDAFCDDALVLRRHRIPRADTLPFIEGDKCRDWLLNTETAAIFPYDKNGRASAPSEQALRRLWLSRSGLRNRKWFRKTQDERGLHWFEYGSLSVPILDDRSSLVFAFVATHNHFAADTGKKVFNRSAPVLKLDAKLDDDDRYGILAVLNSALGCFWMKQVFFPKGGDLVGDSGARVRRTWWDERYEFVGNVLEDFMLVGQLPSTRGKRMHDDAQTLHSAMPHECLREWGSGTTCRESWTELKQRWDELRLQLSSEQEELDWQVHALYGLVDQSYVYGDTAPPINMGERAFEIVLARKMIAGELETTWFQRHGSMPITEIPSHWPGDYRELVERRIAAIESDRNVGLIERPEYKRRWNTETWEARLERTLRIALLGRLESYFDLDGRMNDEGTATARTDVAIISIAKLADLATNDQRFMKLGELYRNDPALDVQALVESLVANESVPLLPVLRYKAPGLRKRDEWEKTWELQRAEDSIDARAKLPEGDPRRLAHEQVTQLKKEQVGDIPVPPKYKNTDFHKSSYWRLRGKLDVPKERWISFPHCEGEDGTAIIAWAGYDHLQLAKAISAHYVEVQERLGGAEDPRLVPLLACLLELLPWLKQWHNQVDPEFNVPMGDYFEGFISDEARQMGKTLDEIRAWKPPKTTRRKKKTKKKAALQTQSAEDTDA